MIYSGREDSRRDKDQGEERGEEREIIPSWEGIQVQLVAVIFGGEEESATRQSSGGASFPKRGMGGRRVSRLCIALCIALACEATTSFDPTAVARLRGGSSAAAWQKQAVEEIEKLDKELGEQEEEIHQDRERAAKG